MCLRNPEAECEIILWWIEEVEIQIVDLVRRRWRRNNDDDDDDDGGQRTQGDSMAQQ